MSVDLISIKTRQVFREYMTGWVLRQISDEFDAARIDCDLTYRPQVGGQRRTLVEQYYHSVNWSDLHDIKKVLQVFENVLLAAEKVLGGMSWDQAGAKQQQAEIEKLIHFLRKDGFHWLDGRIVSGSGMPSLDDIKETAAAFDAKHLADQIRRIEQSIETDPALAIGTAKELVETCCRTIMAERGKPVTGLPDIPTLTKVTLKELKLVPDGIPDQAKGSDIMKRLLSNLATIGQGLAEVRNLYGSGHGRDGKTQAIKPRHAKLAVGAATTLVTFLFETHKETKS